VPVLALTASATKKVADDIMEKLAFQNGQVFRKSFSRPNISFLSYEEENKPGKLLEVARKISGTGIIYVRNRRRTKDIASLLQKAGFSADHYHAGLEMNERNRKQEAWIKGNTRIMACTNAFGMGIDKPDVRFVLHVDLPDSLESYYQEAGRAGRDGKRSYAAILYGQRDIQNLRKSVADRYPPIKFIKKVYQDLCDHYQLAVGAGEGYSFDFEIREFCKTYRLQPLQTFNALKILEHEGLIALTEAVFLSPRVKVSADRKTLYNLEVASRSLAPVIQGILRSYEGAFDHYVRIREKPLAKMVGIDVKTLRQRLEDLQKRRVIYYEPFKDKPQIIFTLPRQDNKKDLGMDVAAIHFRRKVREEKVHGMLYYAANKVSGRERVMHEYFGERSKDNCGHCDVCINRKKTAIAEEAYDKIFEEVEEILKAAPQPLKELPGQVSAKNEASILQAVRWLVDEWLVKENEELKLEWKG
jgi:ATP-dependent DNA helicase RecQ